MRLPGLLKEKLSKALPGDLAGQAMILRWCEYAVERSPACLVGAGLSLGAHPRRGATWADGGSPRARTWSELTERLRDKLELSERTTADPLWVAELYQQNFGRSALLDEVAWAVPQRDLEPSNAHRILAAINWSDLLTTNYDDLLERAAPGYARASVVSDLDLVPAPGTSHSSRVIHLHGKLDVPDSLVVTLEDYRQYPTRRPGLWTKARQVFLERPVLLTGFSAVDPNFVSWTGWVEDTLGKHSPMHLNLNVAEDGAGWSQARRGYWKGRLFVVDVPKKELDRVLGFVRDYLMGEDVPVDFQGRVDEVLGYLTAATEVDDAVSRAREVIARLEHEASPGEQSGLRWRVLESLVRVVASRSMSQDKTESLLRTLALPDRESWSPDWPRPSSGELWTLSEKLDRLRAIFGLAWPAVVRLLLAAGEGETRRIAGVSIPMRDEARRIGDPLEREVRRSLDLDALRRGIAYGTHGVEEVAAAAAEWSVSSAERAGIDALLAYQDLLAGRVVVPPSTAATRVDWCRVGWFATMGLRFEEAGRPTSPRSATLTR